MLKTLAEALNVTPAAVSGMVETMVKRDYLQRTQAEDDRRSVRIKLSDYCCEKIQVLDNFFRGMSETIASHIPEKEFLQIVESLEKLSGSFEKMVPSKINKN
jgi:DNA-binding MarR family transcriptional regulator